MTRPGEPAADHRAATLKIPAAGDPRDPAIQMALLAAIVESSDDAIISKSLDEGIILSWNRGASRMFGYEAHEAIGKPVTIIIPPELHEEERQIISRLRRGERIDHFDTTRIARDGRRIAISLTISPIRDSSGMIIGASKVARDISERKQAEQALSERDEELQAADSRKNEFMAALAHELRNMLAPIRYALAASRKAGSSSADPAAKRASEVIERQTQHMSRLLEDLMDISRVARGTLELKREHVELVPILESAIETARPALNAAGHNLGVDFPAEPVRLEADASRLVQVFANLLINSARYTDPGGDIRLRAEVQGGQVLVSVRDNGMGIPAELMPHIFNLYSRGPAGARRAESGLGIGLSLVRGIVELHGGTVAVRSEGPGKGSEFLVRLALAEQRQQQQKHVTDPGRLAADRAPKVLVVDDNRDAADMCATLLERSGYRVQIAYTGRQALTLVESAVPDALLLDIGLPDMDGYELAQQVRASGSGQDILLIAMTGWTQPEERRRAFAAGFDHHLVKPIDVKLLESLLQHNAQQRSGVRAPVNSGAI